MMTNPLNHLIQQLIQTASLILILVHFTCNWTYNPTVKHLFLDPSCAIVHPSDLLVFAKSRLNDELFVVLC